MRTLTFLDVSGTHSFRVISVTLAVTGPSSIFPVAPCTSLPYENETVAPPLVVIIALPLVVLPWHETPTGHLGHNLGRSRYQKASPRSFPFFRRKNHPH